MSRWELYITWFVLFVIAMGISSVSRHLSQVESKLEEIAERLGLRSYEP